MVHIGNDLKVVWSPVSIEIICKFTLDRVLSLLCLIGLLFVYHFIWFLISVVEWVKQDVQNSCSIPWHHGYLGLLEHVRNNYFPLYYELHALWLVVVEWKYFFCIMVKFIHIFGIKFYHQIDLLFLGFTSSIHGFSIFNPKTKVSCKPTILSQKNWK